MKHPINIKFYTSYRLTLRKRFMTSFIVNYYYLMKNKRVQDGISHHNQRHLYIKKKDLLTCIENSAEQEDKTMYAGKERELMNVKRNGF